MGNRPFNSITAESFRKFGSRDRKSPLARLAIRHCCISITGRTSMALDITAQDIIIDETTGLQDNDVNAAVAPHNNATVTYLLSRDSAGGLTSPEVAFKANFVVASASAGETITSVVLSQNLNGTPFSTTVGVKSD